MLLLALALSAQAAATAPAETVAAVVLDVPAEDRARLERYVDLRPGEPLRDEPVRRTVEVLFATGEFEDVVAEARDLPGGVEVTFRPVPAPRLRQIQVLGDRVRKASAVARIARLRQGDPLTRARLDRAARDVALALAADGYLEAQVSAEAAPAAAADARFTIRAGPRCRVSRLEAEAPASVLEQVRHGARPRRGDVFRRAAAASSAEKIRKDLVGMGFWRATVVVGEQYDPVTAGMALEFEAAPGPFVRLEFEDERPPAGVRRDMERILREGSAKPDVIEAAVDFLEAHYRSEGHREARVTHREEGVPLATRLVYRTEPGPLARVASVRVIGAPEAPLPVLATREATPLQDRLLEEDARRIKRALEDDGHADARVDVEVAEGGGALPVVFRVRPGPRTTIASLEVRADEPLAESSQELRERVSRPYRVRDLALDRADLQTLYRNGGYSRAAVTPEVTFSEDRTEAHVVLAVQAGPRTLVDGIVVTGLEGTREEVVRRELLVEDGRPLGLQAVLESQRRLASLGLFESVSISELDTGEAGRRTLVVRAREGPLTTVAYGLGYAERDFLRGSAEATRRNLFGMDRSLTGFARISFRGSRLLASYREPYLFGRRQELFTTAFREEEDRESFDFIRYGGVLQTSHPLTQAFRLILRYSYLRTNTFNITVDIDEVDRQFQDSTFSGPSVSLVNDARDDALDPRGGHFLGADAYLSANALGGDSFVKSYFQGAFYHRVHSGVILALSGRVGLATTFGSDVPDRLPLPDRFYAGGDYSLRGFKIDSVDPEGGNGLLLGSAELRFDAGRRLSLAAFSDVGNVYPLVSDMTLSDLRYAAGFGIRYRSAVGPIRVDLGFKLNRRGDESLTHLHVTVGHAF
jgi:outer membrane protein assembly complex protein YaeT